jgi:hypothetical protein
MINTTMACNEDNQTRGQTLQNKHPVVIREKQQKRRRRRRKRGGEGKRGKTYRFKET